MSSSSAPVLSSLSLLLLPLLLQALPARAAPSTLPAAAPDISCYVKSCAPLDVALLQEYVTSLNLSSGLNDVDVRTELPPFGALASDWPRLLLLQNGQPEGTELRDNLLRLSRIMLAAYFRAADRDDWKLPADERQSENGSSPGPALQSESENQQANNVTLSSTAQKESTWINASSVDVVVAAATAAYNNEEQSRSGNSSGSENDSTTTTTTTSHYDSSVLPIEAAHFNQTSFTFAGDNKASGSKSNETFADHNEDESSQLAAETSGQFFDTTPSALPKDEEERKEAPNEETTPGKESSAEPSSENSAANEALHERSKEDFRESQYKSKEIKNENGNLPGVAGDESAAGNRVKSDFGNFFAFEEERANKSLSRNPTETSWESRDFSEMSSEELFKAFFGDDNSSDNNNKTLACTSTAERELDSFECNSTKSIEDENSSDRQNATKPPIGVELDIKSEEEPLTRSIEDFFKDDDASSNRANGTEADEASASSIANFFNTETNEITANKLESREKLEGGLGETTHKFSEEAAAAGSGAATSAELLLNETPLYPTEDPSVDERTKSRNIQKEEGTRDSAGELISAQGAELMLQDDRSSESNSTGGDNPAAERTTTATTTTTLAQLTSGRFSTAAYSNEITAAAAAAATAATANGMEDRSAKYRDTSLPATTTTTISTPTLAGDQDKAVAEARSVAAPSSSEPDGNRENRTGDRRDDLFRGTTPTVELQTATDDWSGSTAIPTSIEPATSEGPLVSQLRKRSLMTFQGGSKVLDDEAEGENEEDVWKLKEGALNPPTAGSLRNQERDCRNGIAAGVMRNKRKSRKRADAELDGGKQYRTFLGLERRQT